MFNQAYAPNFASPGARLFQMPSFQTPYIPRPTSFPYTSNAFQVMQLAQQQQQQQQQQQLQKQASSTTMTTTTTTTTTTNHPVGNPTQQDLFPPDKTRVDPVEESDAKNPNKTFEVLTNILPPKSALALSIPTSLVALDNLSSPPREIYTSGDVQLAYASKLTSSPAFAPDRRRSSDLFGLVSDRQGLLINELRVYTGPPIVRWLFPACAFVLLLFGIFTAVWCRPSDQLLYCRIWAAAALTAFSIISFVHRGDYINECLNITFTIFGLVTSVMTLACLYYLMRIFSHRVIEIAQFSNWYEYLEEVRWRMNFLYDTPKYALPISGQPFPGDNEIACLVMDGVQLLADFSSFFIVVSTTLVVDKFYSSLHVVTLKVKPFLQPRFFNPYGQVIVGEFQIFTGFLLQCIIYGNQNITWQSILAPVFAGVLPILAGISSALTLKSCGINSKSWNYLSVTLQIVALVINIVAIILIAAGLVENVRTFNSGTMTQTTFSRRFMIFSCFAFSSAIIVCLVSLCYGVSVTVRLLICVCCPERISTVAFPLEKEKNAKYREVKRLLLKVDDDDNSGGGRHAPVRRSS